MPNKRRHDHLINEIHYAIQAITYALFQGHSEKKKLRAIKEKLFIDLENIEASALCVGGPLSLWQFRELGLKRL